MARELESEVVHAMAKASDSDLAVVELERRLRDARHFRHLRNLPGNSVVELELRLRDARQAAIMAREQLTGVQSRLELARYGREHVIYVYGALVTDEELRYVYRCDSSD